MKLKKLLFTVFLLCAVITVKAQMQQQQQEDRLSYSFDYGNSKATNTKFIQNHLKFMVPLKGSKKSHFSIGAEFGVLNVSHSLTLADSSSLKTLGVIVGYQTMIGNKDRLSVTAEPLISSDFNNISGNDLRFKSDIFYTPATTKKLSFGFGLVYQYQFSGSQILPVIIPIWRISDKVTLSGAFPIIPRLEVKLNQHWSIGAGINGGYSSYRLSSFNNQYVQIQNWSFGFTPKYRVSRHFEMGAFLGFGTRTIAVYDNNQTIPLRIYSWDIGGGSHTPNMEQKFKSPVLNLSVNYRFE